MIVKFKRNILSSKLYLFVFLMNSCRTNGGAAAEICKSDISDDQFYYFGYGSNMLTKRIHIQNPTAIKIGPGLLKDYRLDFNNYSRRWNGAMATIVETPHSSVWGTLWALNNSNLASIDNQEGVHLGIYRAITVPIFLNDGQIINARSYELVKQPECDIAVFSKEEVPLERQPSKTYLQCIVKGAIESGIEESYICRLKSIVHNDRTVKKLEQTLELRDVDL